ncbi:hypothetical protein LJC52_03760 [Bacteroidales bacterium OttesenSCG-928-A17]|nr:hypothetical protein [Bacteroidales bacterium OttesenSCG-928-A17]
MASIRNLKKSIHSITNELFSEGLYLQWFGENNNPEEINKILTKILEKQREFLARANHPNGTKNKKITKEYYQKLIADFNVYIAEIIADFETLQKK